MRLDRTAKQSRPREPNLTYGDWYNALTAIEGFVEHYQVLDFLYYVFGEDRDFTLAVGGIRKNRALPRSIQYVYGARCPLRVKIRSITKSRQNYLLYPRIQHDPPNVFKTVVQVNQVEDDSVANG